MVFLKKRFFIVALIGLLTALYFWTQSRYPDLNSKAVMAQSGTVADTIAARPIFEVRPEFPFAKRVLLTTANWCNDNKKGMAFGVFFAAVLLTLVSYLPQPKAQNRILNTLYGFFIGAPLGVCVNCAAPIFKGMLRSERVETAFAAMLSSPTMNVVVLTMVFTLFPLYMGLLKVGFALVAIFIGVPVLARLLGRDHAVADLARGRVAEKFLTPQAPEIPLEETPEGWLQALRRSLETLLRNLWFMTSRTVPLMVVAGFFGALLSHAVPVQLLADEGTVSAVAIAAVVGVLLPVPMAFDVMLANALYTHGAPVAVVMTLLCTLGIYSMYSFFITWQSASRSWAFGMIALLTVMGFGMGVAAPALHDRFYISPNLAEYRAFDRQPVEESAIDRRSVTPMPDQSRPRQEPIALVEEERGGVKVVSAPFRPRSVDGAKPFRKLEGHELGLSRGFRYGIRDYPDPFWIGRGTAAGDYNRDGWIDVAFGTELGVVLYANRGGWFEVQTLELPMISKSQVYAVAFVDLDNDGWLDLFCSTFNRGNHVILNDQGRLGPERIIKVPNNQAVLTVSPAFADFDGNGFLDVLNGNMALGIVSGFNDFSPRRASSIAFNQGLTFTDRPLLKDLGETMSSLASDIDGDGQMDIVLGHDFVFPDSILIGDGKGGFTERPSTDYLAATSVFTMGLDSGDLNNDLRTDLLFTGTIERRRHVGKVAIDGLGPEEYGKGKWTVETCQGVKDPVARNNCRILRETDHLVPFYQHRNLSVANCQKLPTVEARQDCLLSSMWLLITNEERQWDCEKDFQGDDRLQDICVILREKGARRGIASFAEHRPQIDDNYVYLARPEGGFVDINRTGAEGGAKAFDHPGGWTWSARIADLDNDGWQDVFSAEGAVRSHDFGFNAFMKNVGGQRFEPKQFTYGLTDDFNLFSFSLLDLDFDGDLDIVGNSSIGPVQVYLNQATGENQSLAVTLSQGRGNAYGIGAVIDLEYGGGRRQRRELKASGGYQSFDHPVVYFGLGDVKEVERLHVRWPDGGETTVPGPLAAGRLYQIRREG